MNINITPLPDKGVYPPLADIRKTLRIKWYRCPIEHAKLRTLSERTDKQGWVQAGGHFTLYVSFASLTVYCWAQQFWPAFFIALWCLGFVATFFKGASTHELGHGTVFKTKSLNVFFLHLFSLIGWWTPEDYAASHTYHHRYTTHITADRENILPLAPSLHPWLLFQLVTFNLFTKPNRNFNKGGFLWAVYLTFRSALGMSSGHNHIPSQEWLNTLHSDQPLVFQRSVRWSRVLIGFHASVLLVSIFTGWWVLPLVITVPAYFANIGSYLLGTTQHCGLKQNDSDFRKNTRSIKLNPIIGFLYWHMNWHTEHHMYAGVPCYNLKALAKELQPNMPEPKTLFAAWREMREIWHRQQQEPEYEFDTKVPAEASVSGQQMDEDVVSSIGDLAPKGTQLR